MDRTHIEAICGELDFPKEAAETMLEAWDAIAADAEAAALWKKWIAEYEKNIHMDYRAMFADVDAAAQKAGVHKYTAELLIFLCLAKHLKAVYEQRSIDLQIWHDSCMDLHWKLMECRKVLGIWGSFVAWWFTGFFKLELFALGRLEFELVDFPEEYERAGRKRPEEMTKAINVHIPSSGKLDIEACRASYRQAAAFFADAFPGEEIAFVCDSWMLFPPHKEMLGEESGIVKFMSEYDIFQQAESDHDLWRIFNRREVSDPALLPEDTSLQRAYKRRLQNGDSTGNAAGIFFMKKQEA